MAIKIPFVADVAGVLRGTKDVVSGLEEVEDALDDLGRSRGAEDVEADLDDLGRAADASAEKLETSFSSAFDKLKAEGRTATRSVRDDVDDVRSHGGDTIREFSDEAKQNLAESVSSFQGDAASAVDAVQSTFGGLAASLGPTGVVGAALVAAGIGMVRGMAAKAEEAVKAVSEKAANIAGELIASTPEAERLTDALEEMATTATTRGKFWWTEASTEIADLKLKADDAGVSFEDLALGMAGNASSIDASLAGIDARLQAIRDTSESGTIEGSQVALQTQLQNLKDRLEDVRTAQDLAKRSAALYAVSVEGQAEATEAAWEALKDENDALRESKRLKGDAKEATWDMKEALDGVNQSVKDNGKSLSDNTQKGRDNQRAIKAAVDAINDFGDAQLDATGDVEGTNRKLETQRSALVDKVAKAFGITKTQAEKYIETLGGIPAKKQTDVTVTDNGTAKKTQVLIDSITGKPVTVDVKPDIPGFNQSLNDYLSGKTYPVNVKPVLTGSVTLHRRPGQNVWDWAAV